MLPKADDSWTIYEAAHLLNRAGFGGSPAEIKSFHALGRTKAVDSLLDPAEAIDAIAPPEWTKPEIAAAIYIEYRDMNQAAKEEAKGLPPIEAAEVRRAAVKAGQRKRNEMGAEAQGWWFRKILVTQAPLREKMTLFWHDHFATSYQKVKQPPILVRQNQLFRENAFGNFRDLTKAIAVDPAMMLYLDSQSSKKGAPNENFAREVMELFTLGEGNYTEEDIKEAARAFTGNSINRLRATVDFRKNQWDEGDKQIFGKKGPYKTNDVVDLIFQQKAAASYMPSKIWEYFVAENPPQATVDSLAASFRATDFNTKPLLREIFLSKEFYSEAVVRNQIKPPVQFLVQMLKQLEISQPPLGFAMRGQIELGQQLFSPPNVAGWDWGKAWINTNTLLTRYNLAGYLTKGADATPGMADNGEDTMTMMAEGEKGAKKVGMNRKALRGARNWNGPDYKKIAPPALRENPADLVDSLIFRFFQGPLPEKVRGQFIEYATAKQGVIFTDKEVAELAHLILSTPYYQLA